jgi:hypothetical protein
MEEASAPYLQRWRAGQMSWAGRIAGGAVGVAMLGLVGYVGVPGVRVGNASADVADQPPEAISSQAPPATIGPEAIEAPVTSPTAGKPQAAHPPIGGRPPASAVFVDFPKGFRWENQRLSDFDVANEWGLMTFRDENVQYGSEGARLSVERNRDDPEMPYTMAEIRLPGFYGYGRYEAVMRPSNTPGVLSSFFTHTSGYFGDAHNEIDFEFLGRKPGNVHLNYYNDGADSSASIDLWFEPSGADHLYAFEWMPDSITWYVDGVNVREVLAASAPIPIPDTSSRILANIWAGNGDVAEWVGTPDIESASAVYRCISHLPAGQVGRQCSDTFKSPPKP